VSKEEDQANIVAYDEVGVPITEADLVSESYSRPLDESALSLIPPYDFEGDDDDWDTVCLIESVNERRRILREKGIRNV
jgi:hypothetical protein